MTTKYEIAYLSGRCVNGGNGSKGYTMLTRESAKLSIDDYDYLTWQIHSINALIDRIYDEHEAQLKAKDEEIALLKQCVEEAIKRPMGIEPSIYSDYKMPKGQ